MLLRGMRPYEVAKELGVTKKVISMDMKKIMANWRDSCVRDFESAQATQLQKLANLERTYWDGWERSLKEKRVKRVRDAEKGGFHEIIEEDGVGNPKFLDGVADCIKTTAKLLGLNEEDMIERVRQRSAQLAGAQTVTINIANMNVGDVLAAAERGEPIPVDVLSKLEPGDLLQVHQKMIGVVTGSPVAGG